MLRSRFWVLAVLFVLGISACYKDAGENVQPTSNMVNLTDIAPTHTASPTPMPSLTPTLTSESLVTATRTLVPTTTPAGADQAQAVPTEIPTTVPAQAPEADQPGETTNPPPSAASPTPQATAEIPATPAIRTPGMSDIQPSPTAPPTLDPLHMPTPTDLPVEENPCIHVVKPNDTLYSIAQSNSVLLPELVAANAGVLWAGQDTPLQIGLNLQIPGCETGAPEPAEGAVPAEPVEGDVPAATATWVPGEPITHVVEAGQTIYAIGRLYGVDPQAIIAANNLVDPNLISPGDTLIIPPPN